MSGGKAYLVKSEYPTGYTWTIDLYVYVKEESQSKENNETVLSLGMYAYTPYNIGPWVKTADSYIGTATSGTNCKTFDGAIPNFTGTRWLIENQKITVSHNADGTKTAKIHWKWGVNSSWGGYINPSGSFDYTITPIPRKATVTSVRDFSHNGNPVVYFDNPGKLEVAPYFNIYEDDEKTLVYGVTRGKGSHSSPYTISLTDEERTAMQNATNGQKEYKVWIGVKSYISDTKWEHDSKEAKYTINDVYPTVTVSATLNNGSLPSKFNSTYIKGKSKVNVTVSASGIYNSTIDKKSINAVINGKTYSPSSTPTSNSYGFTSDVINKSGSVEIVGYATDSRGQKGSGKQTITVLDYSKPLIVSIANSILCYRSDGNGKRVGNSTSVWVQAKMSHYPLNAKNECALQWRMKKSSEVWNDTSHTWKDLISKTITTGAQYNALLVDAVFEKDKSYTVQLKAIDDVGEYDVKTFDIPTEDVALHLGKGGKKVSVGSYCDDTIEDYTFHSEWEAIFDNGIHGTLKDVIVEGDILGFAEGCALGITPFSTYDDTTNLPGEGNYRYSSGLVQKRADTKINVFLTDYYNGNIAVNVCYNGQWNGWKYLRLQ